VTEPVGDGRTSPLEAVGWTALYLVTGAALTIALSLGMILLTGGPRSPADSPRNLAIQTAAGLLGYGFLTWAIGLRTLRLTVADLRWSPLSEAGRGFGRGFVLGAVPAILAVGLALVAGQSVLTRDQGSAGLYLERLALTAMLLAPAALLEEIIFRGVGQVVLARAIGRLPAILCLSAPFALAHLLNPNGTVLGFLNIGFAGILLGIAFYMPGGIWSAWGVHLGWNMGLAALDAPVSGLPFRIPVVDYVPGGPGWLTGGRFGPEGGLVATLAIALATTIAWRRRTKERT